MIATPKADVAGRVPVEVVSPAPRLITEQEVMFGTAVVVRPRPTIIRRWSGAASAFAASIHRIVATSRPDARPAHPYYPKRYAFLEYSCMGREMDRL